MPPEPHAGRSQRGGDEDPVPAARTSATRPSRRSSAGGTRCRPATSHTLTQAIPTTSRKIVEIDLVADPARLRQLDLVVLNG